MTCVGLHASSSSMFPPTPGTPGCWRRPLQPSEFSTSTAGIHTKWIAALAPPTRVKRNRKISAMIPDPSSWWSNIKDYGARLPLLIRFARDLARSDRNIFASIVALNLAQAALPAAELYLSRRMIELAYSVGIGIPLNWRTFGLAFLGSLTTTIASLLIDRWSTFYEQRLHSVFSLRVQQSILRLNLSLTDDELALPSTQRQLQLLRELGGSDIYRRIFDPLGFLSVANAILSLVFSGGMLYSQLNSRNTFYLGVSTTFMVIEEWDRWFGQATPTIEHYDISNDAYLRFQALFKMGTSRSLRNEIRMLGLESYLSDQAATSLRELGSTSTVIPSTNSSLRWTSIITRLSRPLSMGIFIIHTALYNDAQLLKNGTTALTSFAEMSILESAVWDLRIRCSRLSSDLKDLKSGADRIQAWYATEDEDFAVKRKKVARRYESVVAEGRRGMKIDFQEVGLRYQRSTNRALDHVSFAVEAGELVAVVGHNGSGKTSLVSLLTRSERSTFGRILINGHDVHEYAPKDLASVSTFTTQNSRESRQTVLPMTIREYVSLGSVAHAHQPEQIKRALQASTADQTVDSLTDGWESYASGMMGSSLSTSDWKLAAIVQRPLPPPTFELLDPAEEKATELSLDGAEEVTSCAMLSSGTTMVDSLGSFKEDTKKTVRVGTTAYPIMVEGEEATVHFPNHSPEACVLSGGQVSSEERTSLFNERGSDYTILTRVLQWQRITLARSLMNPCPDLLVWDEPTAALDPHAEARLYDEMLSKKGKSTIIFTTHRLNICTKVDRVLVFEGGRLVEQGSHAELMKLDPMKGRSRRLWDAHFFPPPPQHPAPEGRWGKFATIASTSEVCYSIFFWNVHHFRMRSPHIRPAPLMSS
ncbi:BZ3500_MvSof-1268-A1-R1_Chr2-3g05300 [Microbotryum saponariae]|uniref:BZ3500_MvSof-1268-A1-R1_Chr2-3g05300 protein n=1 Tax=Microbotryum saponariae TaxID=289078 RepID=A0A2X0L3J0_9BASI|nr:BZ3500_MvSof-1268-A1-R1_Chr2-3g05300 [Microbotryum saponariae]SDA01151.1 BZ3501_MvSof-1269-A2-R1_Chr2-2g04973 [Microbotryum saponariae]